MLISAAISLSSLQTFLRCSCLVGFGRCAFRWHPDCLNRSFLSLSGEGMDFLYQLRFSSHLALLVFAAKRKPLRVAAGLWLLMPCHSSGRCFMACRGTVPLHLQQLPVQRPQSCIFRWLLKDTQEEEIKNKKKKKKTLLCSAEPCNILQNSPTTFSSYNATLFSCDLNKKRWNSLFNILCTFQQSL